MRLRGRLLLASGVYACGSGDGSAVPARRRAATRYHRRAYRRQEFFGF